MNQESPNTPMVEFNDRYELWKECLLGKDRNSIQNQIQEMLFETSSWLVINESRKFYNQAEEGGIQLNGMVHNLIDICFAGSQFSAVRRLVDTYPIVGHKDKRDVHSLVSLLRDLKTHINFLTRENIFPKGIEYDEEKAKEKLTKTINGKFAGFIDPKSIPELTRDQHKRIDQLTGTNPDQRSPENTVRPVIFDNLIKKIDEASHKIKIYCDKFIAHAATQQSRGTFSPEELKLQDLLDTQKTICKSAAFLDHFLLPGSYSLGTPQYDLFKYFAPQFARTVDIPKLIETWKSFKKETESWGTFKIEDLCI